MNARDSVRVRSVALEHTECQNVKVGDLVVCFQVCFLLYFWTLLEFFPSEVISVCKITNRMLRRYE